MAYRILIVDDEAALQNMVKEILTQAGYETASALTCAQALEQFQILPPDAVLLDVNLPDGDGFFLFGQLRKSRDVPVLFLSARDEDADRLQGLGLGEALLRKLLLQAGLYQFKGFQIQMNPLQKIVISKGYYSMGPGKSLSFFAPEEPRGRPAGEKCPSRPGRGCEIHGGIV